MRLTQVGVVVALLGMVAVSATAQCRYFRVKTKMTNCFQMATPTPADSTETTEEDPTLLETPEGPMIRVTCDCDYSLQGSDIRCDYDRSEERSMLIGMENVTGGCKHGKLLCEKVCPAKL